MDVKSVFASSDWNAHKSRVSQLSQAGAIFIHLGQFWQCLCVLCIYHLWRFFFLNYEIPFSVFLPVEYEENRKTQQKDCFKLRSNF